MGNAVKERSLRAEALWRIALFVMVCSAIIWLGGSVVRALIGYDLLLPGSIEIDQYLSADAEREIYRLVALSSLVIIGAYCLTLAGSIVFLSTSPFRIREHPWMLMAAILLYVFVPVEVFTIVLDVRLVYQEFFTTADTAVLRELFLARLGALAGAPLVATFCYFTVVGLAVFQPFRKKSDEVR